MYKKLMRTNLFAACATGALLVTAQTAFSVRSVQAQPATVVKDSDTTLIVEFANAGDSSLLQTIQTTPGVEQIEKFTNFSSAYFDRLYRVTLNASGRAFNLTKQLASLAGVRKVEPVNEVQSFGVEVPAGTKPLSDDDLTEYQWGLRNQGQTTVKDIDDIHSQRTTGVSGMDMQVPDQAELEPQLKRDVIVAVLDSGLDLDHEDMQGAIALNDAECENGKLPANPKVDKDNNGFIGDCMGWNFTSKKSDKGDYRPYDDIGHGTHVAGIIAARTNNKTGVRSMTNRIKVLPVKVMSDTTAKEITPKDTSANGGATTQPATVKAMSLSDRITLGVLYAISRKVDVINMSLGWPSSLDTTYLREAIQEAIKRNIVIVAAAGNNSNNSPVFPCAYEGVICVGSINPAGQMSEFSNYGGKVDLLAPGEQILSLLPFKIDPTLFNVDGYEIMSGTSQSSPFVAAAAAVLKAANPEITNQQVYERLVESAKPMPAGPDKKYTQDGLVQVKSALAAKPAALIRPVFKTLVEVPYEQNGQVDPSLEIPLQNFGSLAGTVNATITVSGAGITTATASKTVSLASGARDAIKVSFKVNNLSADNKINVEVRQTIDGVERVYHDETEVIVALKNHPKLKRLTVQAIPGRAGDLATVQDGRVFSNLRTVYSKFETGAPEYYLPVKNDADKSYNIRIFRTQGDKLVELEKMISVPSAEMFLSLEKWDINDDGVLDYYAKSLARVPGKGLLYQINLVDQALNPLYGDKSRWYFRPENVFTDLRQFTDNSRASWVSYDIEGLGKVKVPYFMAEGQIPAADADPNPWAKADDSSVPRFYYFPPQVTADGVYIQTRLLDSPTFLQKLTKDMNLDWRAGFTALTMVPQNADRFVQNRALGLVQVGQGYLKAPYFVSIGANGKFNMQAIDNGGLPFDAYDFLNVVDNKTGDFFSTVSLQRLYDDVTARWSILDIPSLKILKTPGGVIKHDNPVDSILSSLTVFKGDDASYAFFLTKDNLLLQKQSADGSTAVYKKPIVRFSFLPGTQFTELFYPIISGQPGAFKPAFYVDATQLNNHHVYLLSARDGLSSPIEYNLEVSQQCQALNPARVEQQFNFTFFCKGEADNSYELLFMPMD